MRTLSRPQGGTRNLETDDRNTVEQQNPYDKFEHNLPEWTKPKNMTLEIIPLNNVTREFYSKHGTQHHRDAGLDLVDPVESIIPANSHGCRIPLGINESRHWRNWPTIHALLQVEYLQNPYSFIQPSRSYRPNR